MALGRGIFSIPPGAITLVRPLRVVPYHVRPRLDRKKTVARIDVVRDRKLADPEAPNRLPDDPLPNAAPMSAPLPCCSSTKPHSATATSRWTTNSMLSRTLI